MMTGLEHAQGEYVFLIDVDLEEHPENLTAFWDYLNANAEADVVIGESLTKKQGGLMRRLASSWFYQAVQFPFLYQDIEPELVSRLMRRTYVDSVISYQERELFIPGVWAHAGYNQHYLPAEKTFDGYSTYTLRRRLLLAVDAIASFSSKPLLMVFYTGVLFVIGAVSRNLVPYLQEVRLWLWDLGVGIDGFVPVLHRRRDHFLARCHRHVYREDLHGGKRRPNSIIKTIYREE